MLSAGDTLWIPRGQFDDLTMFEPHLCVVTSDPSQDNERIFLCLVATWREGKDPSCKIEPAECGALDFITVTSYIDYRDSKILPLKTLAELLSKGTMHQQKPIPSALLQRIRLGAINSTFSARGARKLLSAQGLTGY